MNYCSFYSYPLNIGTRTLVIGSSNRFFIKWHIAIHIGFLCVRMKEGFRILFTRIWFPPLFFFFFFSQFDSYYEKLFLRKNHHKIFPINFISTFTQLFSYSRSFKSLFFSYIYDICTFFLQMWWQYRIYMCFFFLITHISFTTRKCAIFRH